MLDLNKIYCGDCLEVMKDIDNNSIDLTVTSPPYDNLRTYEGYTFDFESIAHELYRVTKKSGVVVWVVNDATINGSETGTSFRQALYFKDECGFNLHDTMIWEKPNPVPQFPSMRYQNTFEYMFVFSKGKISTCNYIRVPCKCAGELKTSFKQPSTSGDVRVHKMIAVADDKISGNIWMYPTTSSTCGHPATFPDRLAYDHIYTWSNEGDLILDPMCGSGTTCYAAKTLVRNYIGIDISEKYCDIARERLKQSTLFSP